MPIFVQKCALNIYIVHFVNWLIKYFILLFAEVSAINIEISKIFIYERVLYNEMFCVKCFIVGLRIRVMKE